MCVPYGTAASMNTNKSRIGPSDIATVRRPPSYIGVEILGDEGVVERVGEAPQLELVVLVAGSQLRHLVVVVRRHHVRHLRDRQRERILFTKANIQYQYHKTITSGRLPEGITHQAGCL